MTTLRITGGRIIDPAQGINQAAGSTAARTILGKA
jgi:hypothetical protein